MSKTYQSTLESWVAEPKNTARSVLATIFGDSIAPVGGSIWLGQLFTLTNVFGFSPRLVRTSLYRLTGEGWCLNERVGRQSRYYLTELATRETDQAEQRIYHAPDPLWSGEWVAAFIRSPSLPDDVAQRVAQRLGWQGFLPLRNDMLVSPTATMEQTQDVCNRASPDHRVPLATMTFPELEQLVADDFFAEALSIEHRGKAYDEFVALYESIDAKKATNDPESAFGIRTMLVHDLRRIRLSGPDLPTQLLPDEWPGLRAFEVARSLYPVLSKAVNPWLSSVLELEYPVKIGTRFE